MSYRFALALWVGVSLLAAAGLPARAGAQSRESALGLSPPGPSTASAAPALSDATATPAYPVPTSESGEPQTRLPAPGPVDPGYGGYLPPPGGSLDPSGLDIGAEAGGVRIPARIATRIRVLDRDFAALALRGGTNIVDGVLSCISGALSITVGFLVGDTNSLAPFLFVYGGAYLGRGLVEFFVTPAPGAQALTYGRMPMASVDDVRARLTYGEANLEGIANQARLARILDGGISIATALAYVPVYLLPKSSIAFTELQDWFVTIMAGVSLISGVVTLFSTSDPERRWDAYAQLRQRLSDEHRRERGQEPAPITGHDDDDLARLPLPTPDPFTARGTLAAMPGGAGFVLTGTF